MLAEVLIWMYDKINKSALSSVVVSNGDFCRVNREKCSMGKAMIQILLRSESEVQFKKFQVILLFAVLFNLSAMNAWAAQGQWASFIYLFQKSDALVDDSSTIGLANKISQISTGFSNDFKPQKGKTDTIHYIRVNDYLLKGESLAGKPFGLIRIESTDKKILDRYVESLADLVKDRFRLEARFAVTRQLNYTDADTLQRLKDNAPKRGNGEEQPNVVVFPLSKTAAWWGQTQEKRQNYFFENPALFGKDHIGHNGVGFKYIQHIFRKLYHSRFIDSKQDFMTYFEYADADASTFDALLSGLRNPGLNQEWEYVEEKPIVYGKRMATPEEMLKP